MKKLFIYIGLVHFINLSSQVGIGTKTPDPASSLEVSSTNKGVLLPRVNLTSTTMDLDGNASTLQPAGLLVYNNGTVLTKGYYFWNGVEWRTISNDLGVAPQVASINCDYAVLTPSSYNAGIPFSGTLSVPYTGGNGGTYSSGNSITSNGLTFKLQQNKLNIGNGNLNFNVTGTPTASSPTGSTVTINNTSVPFYTGTSCTATVGDESVAAIESKSTISGFMAEGTTTNSRSDILTIGSLSFRLYFSTNTVGAAYSNLVNTQVRNNTSTTFAIYNYSFGVYNNNAAITTYGTINLPPNTWTNIGELGVLFDASEKRQYLITPVSSTDKTAYRVEFLLAGSANSNIRTTAKAVILAEYLNNNQQ